MPTTFKPADVTAAIPPVDSLANHRVSSMRRSPPTLTFTLEQVTLNHLNSIRKMVSPEVIPLIDAAAELTERCPRLLEGRGAGGRGRSGHAEGGAAGQSGAERAEEGERARP